jgi:hypothetical protein
MTPTSVRKKIEELAFARDKLRGDIRASQRDIQSSKMIHAALLLLMLEAVDTDLVFTISLKRSTQNLQLSTSSPADYPIFGPLPEVNSFARLYRGPRVACRLLRVLRGAGGILQLLHVRGRQLRPIERDGYLVDLAGEGERHLVVAVIHRCGAGLADVERLVKRQDQGKGPLELLGRHHLVVHLQRPGAAAADTARIVVRQRRLAEPVVPEVVHDRMLAGGQRLRSLPTGPLEVEQVVREHRFAFQQVQRIPDKSSALADDDAFGPALRHIDVGGDGVGR